MALAFAGIIGLIFSILGVTILIGKIAKSAQAPTRKLTSQEEQAYLLKPEVPVPPEEAHG